MVVPSDWWKHFFFGVSLDLWRQAVPEEVTRAEAEFLHSTLALPRGAKVLDVPCGNGRLSLELAARGYQMTGLDIAQKFIDEAKAKSAERNLNIAWYQGNMIELRWQNEFEGAFCFGNSFGYFEDEENATFLKGVSRSLQRGAKFILDTHSIAETTLPTFQKHREFQIGNITLILDHAYNLKAGRVDTEYTFVRNGQAEKRTATHRIYTYRELLGLLRDAGFDGLEAYGGLAKESFQVGSPRLLVISRKQ